MAERAVAGVDGAPGGWVIVLAPQGRLDEVRVATAPTFAEVLSITARCAAVAVDMPIGLPERSGPGGRTADVAARANLGDRQSSLFAVPSRRAVAALSFEEACASALLTSDPPRKVSKQIFNLFPRIREVDALMTPALQERVVECHPELAFWALNGECALALPKKLKSRPFADGLALRLDLLERAGFNRKVLTDLGPIRLARGGGDDLLDAAACCWSALRYARGVGRRFPAEPPIDAKGLRMEIWC